jgi:hypothetical protein
MSPLRTTLPRTTSAAAVLAGAALLLSAGGASARPAEQFDSGPSLPPTPAETYAQEPAVTPVAVPGDGSGGTDTLTVLAVAGGTLLVGAAGGFGSGRVIARRQPLRP